MNNYYDVLGVSKDATKEEIKKAYKSLVKKYHPDIYKGEDREERFKEIQKAYETLYDDAKRSQYDNVGHSGYEDQQRYQSGYSSYRDVHGFNDFRGYSSVKLKSFKDMKWYWQIIIIVGFIFLIGIIIVVSIIGFIIWLIRQIIKMIFGK